MKLPRQNPNYVQPLLLLGEQRERPRIQAALDRWGIAGPVGLIAAGWEEDEFEDDWLRESVSNPVVNSKLYELADQLFAEDPEVLKLLRDRQDALRELREINQVQTDRLCETARELLRRDATQETVRQPLATSFRHLQEVDAEYLATVSDTIRSFDQKISPDTRASAISYRQKVLKRLAGCEAILIAGGHVGVLLNRLKLSRLLSHISLPVIAWSGGAMALGRQVYFFHQFIPHVTGEIELSRKGMGWFEGIQLFPRSAERLKLNDPVEMALLGRRVPDPCLLMTDSSELEWVGSKLIRVEGVKTILPRGQVLGWRP